MLGTILGTGSRKMNKTDGVPQTQERKTRHMDVQVT